MLGLKSLIRYFPVFVFSFLIAGTSVQVNARGKKDAAALKAMKDFAKGEYGIVAWMSRGGNGTHIYACDLDGSNFHQVSSNATNRNYSPMISPDGKRLIYYARSSGGKYYGDHTGNMVLVDVAAEKGKGAKTLVKGCRTFGELRWARWLDNDRIAYIAGNHETHQVTISTGKTKKLYGGQSSFGAVPNPQLTHAVRGKGNIYYKISGQSLKKVKDFDGCQGNLSMDGKWGYRVGGLQSGFHPVKKFKLSDLRDGTLLKPQDPAFPKPQNYLYYPQISSDMRFIAVGVSRGKKYDEHDHEKADYDIFVVRIDPDKLTTTSKACKYSFSGGCDSYPDIWVGKKSGQTSVTPFMIVPAGQQRLSVYRGHGGNVFVVLPGSGRGRLAIFSADGGLLHSRVVNTARGVTLPRSMFSAGMYLFTTADMTGTTRQTRLVIE